LVKTEFGKTIAAFNPYKWHSIPDGKSGGNHAGGSFILALDLQEKLIPINTAHLVSNVPSYGPVFGSGCDMAIGDQCNSNSNSQAGLISTYNTADLKYKHNQ
jgi:hypothetical protein